MVLSPRARRYKRPQFVFAAGILSRAGAKAPLAQNDHGIAMTTRIEIGFLLWEEAHMRQMLTKGKGLTFDTLVVTTSAGMPANVPLRTCRSRVSQGQWTPSSKAQFTIGHLVRKL